LLSVRTDIKPFLPTDINNWLRSPETLEYVKVVEEDLDLKPVASTDLEIHKSSLTKVVTLIK